METFLQPPGRAAGERRPRGAGQETGPRAAAGKDMAHAHAEWKSE